MLTWKGDAFLELCALKSSFWSSLALFEKLHLYPEFHSQVLQLSLWLLCLSWDGGRSSYLHIVTGRAAWAWLWMSEDGTAWGAADRRCTTEFHMLMKKEEWLNKAGLEFRPWLVFPKIFTSLLFYLHFLSGMSRCGILAVFPFRLQLWDFACWLWQEWWRGAPAPWLCHVVCHRLCETSYFFKKSRYTVCHIY